MNNPPFDIGLTCGNPIVVWVSGVLVIVVILFKKYINTEVTVNEYKTFLKKT
jgi:hypothetical protein